MRVGKVIPAPHRTRARRRGPRARVGLRSGVARAFLWTYCLVPERRSPGTPLVADAFYDLKLEASVHLLAEASPLRVLLVEPGGGAVCFYGAESPEGRLPFGRLEPVGEVVLGRCADKGKTLPRRNLRQEKGGHRNAQIWLENDCRGGEGGLLGDGNIGQQGS
jgi:hypothetical protein